MSLVGEPDIITGMVIDIGVLRAGIDAVREQLAHQFLDEVEGLGIPTLENLCALIASQMATKLPHGVSE